MFADLCTDTETMIRHHLPFRLSAQYCIWLCLLLIDLSFASLASARLFPILSTEDFAPFSSSIPDFDKDEKLHPSFLRSSSPNILRLTKDGVVRSRNPVWNVCISGKPIRKGLVMRNVDTFEYRRGHVRLRIPFTCRDYHRGNLSVWRHPDFQDLDMFLDAKGRLIGGVPFPYIAVRD